MTALEIQPDSHQGDDDEYTSEVSCRSSLESLRDDTTGANNGAMDHSLGSFLEHQPTSWLDSLHEEAKQSDNIVHRRFLLSLLDYTTQRETARGVATTVDQLYSDLLVEPLADTEGFLWFVWGTCLRLVRQMHHQDENIDHVVLAIEQLVAIQEQRHMNVRLVDPYKGRR